ncbi:hypothetical protein HYD79_01040 [Mycoplasmopsis bovis]|nr:hypothetical protein [Mycoplasmopsis bovis]QQH43031.1 hypothetical protein HYD79_01040 [Mycoplasmopsis bovis]
MKKIRELVNRWTNSTSNGEEMRLADDNRVSVNSSIRLVNHFFSFL